LNCNAVYSGGHERKAAEARRRPAKNPHSPLTKANRFWYLLEVTVGVV
jgi:hypothetical protein